MSTRIDVLNRRERRGDKEKNVTQIDRETEAQRGEF
jgi:hypothetical protein